MFEFGIGASENEIKISLLFLQTNITYFYNGPREANAGIKNFYPSDSKSG